MESPVETVQKNGIFVKNQWMCNCTPRLPATNNKVRKQCKNEGRLFWSCKNWNGGGGDQKDCGFFLWNDEAKIREMQAISNIGKKPSSVATPSRPLQQSKLSSGVLGLHKPSGTRTETEPATGNLPPSVPEASELVSETGEKDPSIFDTPRKAARTDKNTSPNKQQLLAETMASRNSFNNSSSATNIGEETPSGRFQNLALKTPYSNARIQSEQRFNALSPVKRPNFGTVANNTPKRPAEPANPFASTLKENVSFGEQREQMQPRVTEEVIDATKEVLAIIDNSGLMIQGELRAELTASLERIKRQSTAFHAARNMTRQKLREEKVITDDLRSEIGRLQAEVKTLNKEKRDLKRSHDQSEDLRKGDLEIMSSMNKDIAKLTEEKEDLQRKLEDISERFEE